MPDQRNRSNGSSNSGKGKTHDANKKHRRLKPTPNAPITNRATTTMAAQALRHQRRKLASGGSAED